MHNVACPVILPQLKTLTPDDEQKLTPYQQGIYHGMSEMLELVKTALMRTGVEYQEGHHAQR